MNKFVRITYAAEPSGIFPPRSRGESSIESGRMTQNSVECSRIPNFKIEYATFQNSKCQRRPKARDSETLDSKITDSQTPDSLTPDSKTPDSVLGIRQLVNHHIYMFT